MTEELKEDSKRKMRRVAILLMLAFFVIMECFVLSSAKYRHDHSESVGVAEEMSLQLSLISVALKSGNQAMYADAVTKYRAALDEFAKNNYVRKSAKNLLNSLEQYSATLLEDSELIGQMTELSIAANTITTAANDAQKSTVDAAKAYSIANDYKSFRDALDRITAPELQDLKSKLISMSNEIAQTIENSAVCIAVCSGEILAQKQSAINVVVERYGEDIEALSLALSKKYDPNQLILDLSDYSKL